MDNIRSISLEGRIPKRKAITFLRAEINAKRRSPFALIHYLYNRSEQEYGLRLDLDKRVFLDHPFPEEEENEALDEAAPGIVEYLGSVLYPEVHAS